MESMPVPEQKWIVMIAIVGAFVVTITTGLCILMKRRIKGKEGAEGHTNTVTVSSTTMEVEQSEGSSDPNSLSSITSEYDVFLSFRGPDARYGIVDHLYECMTGAGLRVFKDDEEIRHGEVIGGELERAIRGSRVYAVVFSRNYASSAWCLRELDVMVDLHGGSNVGGKIILPIFYGADPADVKLRTELYREALDAHKDRHGQDIVKKWEEALKMVGGISGWDSKAILGEGRFVRLIVQDIIVNMRIKDQTLPDHLTGIDDQVIHMLNLLDYNSSGVRFVVLHGMGGIGKTTLARVIFNILILASQFEGFSFMSNVRESATGHGGIANLQNKLSRDILGGQYARSCNFDDGSSEMIQRIRGKKMLLVLDDVDQFSQLEKLVGKDPKDTLGTGSRVIITTRDKSVCNRFVRLDSELLRFYEMEKMADNYALQLFSRHAFGTDEPPEDYLSLSKQVVKTTGNLPLALVVIAGHFCCQSKESWKDEFETLKNVLQEGVFNILKVSYDGLEWREKEIFLDIACFRKAMHRKYADYLWEARDLYPKSAVKVLINKSLIKTDSKGEFWIHDQLRDMGREIIRSEGFGRPEMCTRLWDPDDALKIVLQKKVSEKIIAMDLDLGSIIGEHKLSDENFRGLSNLLYLHLKGKHQFIGDFGSIREKLMWLSWWDCNQWLNPNIFKMSNLVVLYLQGRWRSVEKLIMPKLRVLKFWGSDMTMTPDVSCCLKLEIMVFEYFENLIEIHHSVGNLASLTYLKIYNCPSMRSLPKELCCARSLRELIVTECKIEEVPESIGRLEPLRTLDLRRNNIRRLPASICGLKNLLVLHAANNPLDEGIPEEIGRLSALEELDLSGSKIPFMPATVSQLSSLKSLRLNGCEMLQKVRGLPTSLTLLDASRCPLEEGIPDEIGSLSALEELNLSGSKIPFLPATVSQLTSLKSLKLYGCNMLQELRGLPTSLTVLDSSRCPLEKGIPEEIGNLSALEELDLSYTNIRFLPATVGGLMSLKSLKLNCCRMLQEVRGLPTSLTLLDASNCPLEEGILEGVKSLSALERWDFSGRNIRFLPATVSQLTSLKSLILHGCEMLQELRGLPTSLTVLDASNCPLDEGIPEEIGRLSALEELNLSGSKIPFLPATFSQLTSLKSLKLYGCDMLHELRGLPTSLTDFAFSWKTVGLSEEIDCTKEYGTRIITFRGVPELGFLSRLKTLDLSFPDMVSLQTYVNITDFTLTEMELGGLDSLPGLTKLSINKSHSLVRVSNIGRLWGLRSLEFSWCRALVEIPGLEQLEMLEELIFESCDSICGIQDLLGLKRLKEVTITSCSSLLRMPRVIDKCRVSICFCDKLEYFVGSYWEYGRNFKSRW